MIVTLLLKYSNSNNMAPFWYLGTSLVIGAIALALFDEKRYNI